MLEISKHLKLEDDIFFVTGYQRGYSAGLTDSMYLLKLVNCAELINTTGLDDRQIVKKGELKLKEVTIVRAILKEDPENFSQLLKENFLPKYRRKILDKEYSLK